MYWSKHIISTDQMQRVYALLSPASTAGQNPQLLAHHSSPSGPLTRVFCEGPLYPLHNTSHWLFNHLATLGVSYCHYCLLPEAQVTPINLAVRGSSEAQTEVDQNAASHLLHFAASVLECSPAEGHGISSVQCWVFSLGLNEPLQTSWKDLLPSINS